MESLESLKDYLIADWIMKVKQMTREELERELIELKSRQLESLKDLNEVMKYGKQKSKA